MFLIAAAALATVSTPQPATAVTAQASATIRVVAAVRLKFDADVNPGAPPARKTVLTLSDGTTQAAKLIEFQ